MPAGKRPRPDIDVEFLRDVIRGKGRSLEEAAFRVFDPLPRDAEMAPPLNRQELRARQDRFFAAGTLRIEREGKPAGRRRLVYIQSGKRLDPALLSEPRAHDVLLNYYDQSPPNPHAETVVYQRGCKNTAIRRLLELRPDLLLQYDRVLFLDDDIEIGPAQIDLLFEVAEREKLDLAGPSLTADSQTAWPFLRQPGAGQGIMRVSSIEIMAPLITRRALEAVAWVFAESASGWGGDLLLGPVVRGAFGPQSVGVIGASRSGMRGRSTPRAGRSTSIFAAMASRPDTKPTGSRLTSASIAFFDRSRPAKRARSAAVRSPVSVRWRNPRWPDFPSVTLHASD